MGSSDTEDAMLRAAIAASLRDSRPQSQTAEATSPPAQSEVVDLTIDSDSDKEADVKQVFPKSKSVVGSDTDNSADEEDDEDLRAALALSLEGVHPDSDDDESATTQATEKPANAPELSQLSSFLGMDRKKMEEERLARLAKRKADNGDGSLGPRPAKATKVEAIEIPDADDSDRPTPHATSSREVPTPAICNQFAANDRQCGVKPTARPIPQWPLGAVKKTVVSMVPRTYNDITLEEVLQHGDLELAVLSSFMWDMEWLFSKMNTWQTRFILVMHAKEEQTVRMQIFQILRARP